MRRRRKRRGAWLPVLGHTDIDGEEAYHYSWFRVGPLFVPNSNGSSPAQEAFAIVPDFSIPAPEGTQEHTLHDQVSGNAWRLRRIVGKLHLDCSTPASATSPGDGFQWPAVFVKAGFFVARAGDANQSFPELTALESDPQEAGNVMNPWIWQKSWILSNPLARNSVNLSYGSRALWPTNNSSYGSVSDGPHIDSKMARFINKEHRLWFVLTAAGYDPEYSGVSGNNNTQPLVSGILDLRIYGQMARQRNTSSF